MGNHQQRVHTFQQDHHWQFHKLWDIEYVGGNHYDNQLTRKFISKMLL
jgi:hypothetical protein